MASIRLGSLLFTVYPNDHPPRHVHGFYAECEVIIDLLQDGTVNLAKRPDAIRPAGAKRSDVRHILGQAAENFELLVALWEKHHA